jgi:hypothetical protein
MYELKQFSDLPLRGIWAEMCETEGKKGRGSFSLTWLLPKFTLFSLTSVSCWWRFDVTSTVRKLIVLGVQ